MNDLEQWLADVRAFNTDANLFCLVNFASLDNRHEALQKQGRELGLKRSKIKSMLASVRLKVEMPEEKAGT